MADKIETMIPRDPTGLRNNVTILLECARKKELSELLLIYRSKDESTHCYWSGTDMKCVALAEMIKADLLKRYTDSGTESIVYDENPTEGG